jgi:hypothetical protein
LAPQIIHDTVATWPAVPAVAANDQFVDRQVSYEPHRDVDQVPDTLASSQLVHDGGHELAATLGRGFVEHFGQQLAVLGGKHVHRAFQAIAGRQDPHQFEQVANGAQREGLQFLDRARLLLQPLGHLGRIKNQREKFLKLLWLHSSGEQLLDDGAQRPRGVVDHMPQLLVLTVNVADDMDGALGQRQDCREPRDLRHRRIDVWEPLRQRSQEDQFGLTCLQHIDILLV